MTRTTDPKPRPARGGRYVRDPETGALTPAADAVAAAPAPEDAPETAPPAARPRRKPRKGA